MELVPIIYTALKIVAAFAIITITISYFIYRFKQKRGIEGETARIIAQPVISTEKTVKKVVQRITKPLHYDHIPEKPHHKPLQANQANLQKAEKEKHIEKKHVVKTKKSESTNHQKERIEIVKNLTPKNVKDKNETPLPHKEIPKRTTSEKKLNSLGEDIIEKYIDEDDKEFYTLNVKDKKSSK